MARASDATTSDGTGAAVITFRPTLALGWVVQQVNISAPASTLLGTCQLAVDGVPVCASAAGSGDSTDGNPVTAQSDVTLTWAGLSPGVQVFATVFFQ